MSRKNERRRPDHSHGGDRGHPHARVTPEDVTAYAAGILDADEAARVAEALDRDPSLLGLVEPALCVGNVLHQDVDVPPPPRLLERTIRLGYMANAAERCRWSFASLVRYPVSPLALRLMDLAVAALVLVVVAGLLMPALARVRELHRVLACRENLRNIGIAQLAYADQYSGRLPQTRWSVGSGAPAAIQPIMLVEHGYLRDASYLSCCGPYSGTGETVEGLREALKVAPAEVAERLRAATGSYAFYNGCFVDRCYAAPRLPARQAGLKANFVLVADRPALDQSGGVLVDANSDNHGGTGQNVLCADLRVAYVQVPRLGPGGDKIYANRADRVGAALGWADIALTIGDILPDGPFSIYSTAVRTPVRTCY